MRTRKELLEAPVREWYVQQLHHVIGLYIIPNGRKHDSGWGCMTYVAEIRVGEHKTKLVRCNGDSDHLWLGVKNLSVDCTYPYKVIHIHNHGSEMKLDTNSSSVMLEEDDGIVEN